MHLEGLETRYPAQLSGGQQQRLALARTIVLEPNLLLLDEPLSNLDANLRNEMRIEIKRLHTELGLTTLYVTHDQSEAMSLSDRVVVMRQGAIEQEGTPQEIYNQPKSLYVAHFMGYANRLPAEIVGREGEQFVVQTPAGSQLRATSTLAASQDWQPGQKVLACFRPDEARTDLHKTSNRLQGRVQLMEYMGKTFEVLVRLEANSGPDMLDKSALRVDKSTLYGRTLLVHSPIPLEGGSLVDFEIAPERLLLFPVQGEILSTPASPVSSTGEPALEGRR